MAISMHYVQHRNGKLGPEYKPCENSPCPMHDNNSVTGFTIPDDKIDNNNYIDSIATRKYERISSFSVIVVSTINMSSLLSIDGKLNNMGLSGSMNGTPIGWKGFNTCGLYSGVSYENDVSNVISDVKSISSSNVTKTFIATYNGLGVNHILSRNVKSYQDAVHVVKSINAFLHKRIRATYNDNILLIQDFYPPLSKSDINIITKMLRFSSDNVMIV